MCPDNDMSSEILFHEVILFMSLVSFVRKSIKKYQLLQVILK